MKDQEIDEEEKLKKGAKAIIFLQKMVGITETVEEATVGWMGMSDHEQEFTMSFFERLKGSNN